VRSPEDAAALLQANPPGSAVDLTVVPQVAATQVIVGKDAKVVAVAAGQLLQLPTLEQLGMKIERARPPRARGSYSHFITYSDEMQMLLALTFGLSLSLQRPFRLPAFAVIVLVAIFALALGATLSRSAWLAAALACLLQLWFHVKRRAIRIVLPIAFVLAALGTNLAMQHWRGVDLIDAHDASTGYRVLMWKDSVKFIREHPLFGIGMNTMRDAWPKFDLAAFRIYGRRSHFHSTPIQYAVDMGLLVLAAWLVLMGAYWLMLVRLVDRARNQPDRMTYGLTLGILGATTGFLANSLVQYNFGDSVVVLLFWFLMGSALAIYHHLSLTPMKQDSV
jgi:O-antigen ligase